MSSGLGGGLRLGGGIGGGTYMHACIDAALIHVCTTGTHCACFDHSPTRVLLIFQTVSVQYYAKLI